MSLIRSNFYRKVVPFSRNVLSRNALWCSQRKTEGIIVKRGLHGSQRKCAELRSPGKIFEFGERDIYQTEIYHYTSLGLAGLLPLGLILPSSIVFPVDLALGVLMPLHGHLGMKLVLDDYLPDYEKMTKRILLIASVITGVGLLGLNVFGIGISGTLKQLWKKPEQKNENENEKEQEQSTH